MVFLLNLMILALKLYKKLAALFVYHYVFPRKCHIHESFLSLFLDFKCIILIELFIKHQLFVSPGGKLLQSPIFKGCYFDFELFPIFLAMSFLLKKVQSFLINKTDGLMENAQAIYRATLLATCTLFYSVTLPQEVFKEVVTPEAYVLSG